MGNVDFLLDHLMQTAQAISNLDIRDIEPMIDILERAKERNCFVWLMGNGGSASTASHFANDLEKQCGIRAVCIPDMVPMMLAHGNDDGWSQMFSRILDGYASPQDVVILFSCSGNSENIVEVAGEWEGETIVFTGDNQDSRVVQETRAAAIVFVYQPDIMIQESVHLAICHAIVKALKRSKHVGA